MDKIYVLNYHTWDRNKKKLIGSEWSPVGYFTSKERAMQELKNEISRRPEQKLIKAPWWFVLQDDRKDCYWDHTYEIWEITLDETTFDNMIKSRMDLLELERVV